MAAIVAALPKTMAAHSDRWLAERAMAVIHGLANPYDRVNGFHNSALLRSQ